MSLGTRRPPLGIRSGNPSDRSRQLRSSFHGNLRGSRTPHYWSEVGNRVPGYLALASLALLRSLHSIVENGSERRGIKRFETYVAYLKTFDLLVSVVLDCQLNPVLSAGCGCRLASSTSSEYIFSRLDCSFRCFCPRWMKE